MTLSPVGCIECDGPVTDDESEHYDGICEKCARADWERLQRWRAGHPDPYYDAAFPDLEVSPTDGAEPAPPKVRHPNLHTEKDHGHG